VKILIFLLMFGLMEENVLVLNFHPLPIPSNWYETKNGNQLECFSLVHFLIYLFN